MPQARRFCGAERSQAALEIEARTAALILEASGWRGGEAIQHQAEERLRPREVPTEVRPASAAVRELPRASREPGVLIRRLAVHGAALRVGEAPEVELDPVRIDLRVRVAARDLNSTIFPSHV